MRNKRRFDSKLKLCTKGRIVLSPLDFLTSSTFLRFLLSYYIFSYLLTSLSYAIYSNMEVWMCLTSTQIFLNFWTFKCQRMNYETHLTNMTITTTHIVWKSPKTSHLNIGIFNFFCPIKIDLSGNTVWLQGSVFQKFVKLIIVLVILGSFCPLKMWP